MAGSAAVLFALAVGYGSRCSLRAQHSGSVGLVLTVAQRTYTIPLAVTLRTSRDCPYLLRQALTVAGILVLILAGAGLLAFFVLPIPIAFVVLALTLFAVKGYGGLRHRQRRGVALPAR